MAADGQAAIVNTSGNADGHVILRGGKQTGPNYDEATIARVIAGLTAKKLTPRLMVDCSHGNSQKDHSKQPIVAGDVANQVSQGGTNIFGLMVESHINEGRQNLKAGEELNYGQSITDACLGWENTQSLLETLAQAVKARRQA